MSVYDLEAAGFLSPERGGVGEEPFDDRLLGGRSHENRVVLENDLGRESPIRASIPMELGNIGFEPDQSVTHLFLQDGIVVLLEELDELVLVAPGHTIEVPDCSLASRRGLRSKARERRSDQHPDDESEYQRQRFLHEFLLALIMKVAIFVPLR